MKGWSDVRAIQLGASGIGWVRLVEGGVFAIELPRNKINCPVSLILAKKRK